MMDLKQIERLMAVMGRTGIKRVAIKQEGFEIELERECASDHSPSVVYAAPPAPLSHSYSSFGSAPQSDEKNGQAADKQEFGARFITSPMVGTFYSAPSPEDTPYVKPGDEVEEQSVVCIIEAMKVMNEVKAGVRGKVVEVLLKNGDPVEFGTKIFRIV